MFLITQTFTRSDIIPMMSKYAGSAFIKKNKPTKTINLNQINKSTSVEILMICAAYSKHQGTIKASLQLQSDCFGYRKVLLNYG